MIDAVTKWNKARSPDAETVNWLNLLEEDLADPVPEEVWAEFGLQLISLHPEETIETDAHGDVFEPGKAPQG